MESTSFNLQQSIDKYISRIINQGSVTGADAAELKAHLFDAVDELQKTGLSEEESFLIACKRLGTGDLLTEEFAKVNTSVQTNKIWAYLILGFNLLYSLPAILFTLTGFFYLTIYRSYHTSNIGTFFITAFNLIFVSFVWFIVKKKKEISKFLEMQVENNVLRILGLSFIPVVINIATARLNKAEALRALNYPVYKFDSDIAEFSLYMCMMCIAMGTLCLVFSVNKMENISFKAFFERPSAVLLVIFGVIVSMFAASTRALKVDNILLGGLIFGSVYMALSFGISFYNKRQSVNKYILIASSFGFVSEMAVGTYADIDRGNTYNTIYFVGGMLLGLAAGRALGLKLQASGSADAG